MTVLQRVLPARIAFRPAARFRRPFCRTFHYDSGSIATTRMRCLGTRRIILPTVSTNHTRNYSNSKSSKALNGGSAVSSSDRPEDKVMKDTDFEEDSGIAPETTTDEVVVSGEESEQLEVVNSALDQMMEQESVVDMVEEEVVEEVPSKGALPTAAPEPTKAMVSLDVARTVLRNFQRYSKLYYADRKQKLYIIFSKNMNPLAFARAKPTILAKMKEFHDRKLIPQPISVDLIPPGIFAHSAVSIDFLARDYIPPAVKYADFWTNFWGERNIFDVRSVDDYHDWVSSMLVVPGLGPSDVRGGKLQELLRQENPGIFDDPLGRPEQGHPFASFFSHGSDSNKICVKIPPASYWKVFSQDGLMLLGKRRFLKVNSDKSLDFEYKVARIWYASPHSIGRNNKYMEYNYIYQLGIIEALKTMRDPNDREERQQMIETIKTMTPPPSPPIETVEQRKPKQQNAESKQRSRAKAKILKASKAPVVKKKGYIKAIRVGGRLIVKFVEYEQESKATQPAKKDTILPYKEHKAPVLERLALKTAPSAFSTGKKSKLTPVNPDFMPMGKVSRLTPVDSSEYTGY